MQRHIPWWYWCIMAGTAAALAVACLSVRRPAPLYVPWGDEYRGFPFAYAMTEGDVRGPDGRPVVEDWSVVRLALDVLAASVCGVLVCLPVLPLLRGRRGRDKSLPTV